MGAIVPGMPRAAAVTAPTQSGQGHVSTVGGDQGREVCDGLVPAVSPCEHDAHVAGLSMTRTWRDARVDRGVGR
jgi:hypothetical protein